MGAELLVAEQEVSNYGSNPWEARLNTYMCFQHPTGLLELYRGESFDRKPNPGMLLRAMLEAEVAPVDTLMIGDRAEDRQAATNAGCLFSWADTFFAPAAQEEHYV